MQQIAPGVLTVVFTVMCQVASSVARAQAVPDDLPLLAHAGADTRRSVSLEEIVVLGRTESLLGKAAAASQGVALQSDLQAMPYLRSGEVLELVPGMLVTQHSGTGKANQYFLRGFNLDHGTDFAGFVENVPINLPTHAHGQGYLDLNFLVPELIERVDYRKGPYYADTGDFASAGSARIKLVDELSRGLLSVGIGEDSFYRLLVADSFDVQDGKLLAAFEAQYYDGPWDEGEHLGKFNGVAKYTVRQGDDGATLGFMAYRAKWDSTDQIPQRAVDAGLIDRLGTVDDTDGGSTTRLTAFANLWSSGDGGVTRVNVYGAYYALNLFSNFTYFLDDLVNGDQFEQEDRRFYGGGEITHDWRADLLNLHMDHTVGLQVRHDFIDTVGLHNTAARSRLSTVREDSVHETAAGVFYENRIEWHEKVRTILGVRGDLYRFDVDSDADVNSGVEYDAIASPKAGLVLGPWRRTEFYANWGMGFHSNDARGVTISVDPDTGLATDAVDPLVRSQGAEFGVRSSAIVPEITTTVALWWLDLDSELLFVGDAGNTTASRPSRRYGVEIVNAWKPDEALTLDFTFAHSIARFRDDDPAGDHIPGAVEAAISAGATLDLQCGFFTALHLRHFGPRPLVEDASVESDSTTVLNWRLGYEAKDWIITLDILNALNSDDHDIDYFYTSRLPGEGGGGVDDVHFHPVEPLTVRVYFTLKF